MDFDLPQEIAFENVSLAEVSGPNDFSYTYVPGDFSEQDRTFTRHFVLGESGAPSATGLYSFHVVTNDALHYYADTTLTTAVSYPAPDSVAYQIENLEEVENPDNDRYRFSWADVNYNGLLYYRIMFLNGSGEYYITSRQNKNNVVVDMKNVTSQLGDGPLQWRVEVHDSSSGRTLRNRRNGPWVALSLPAYDPTKPLLMGRFDNLNDSQR